MLFAGICCFAQENSLVVIGGEESGIRKFEQNGLQGLLDYPSGEIILPAEYTGIKEDFRGRYVVEQGRSKGLYNTRLRKMVIPVNYDELSVTNLRRSSGSSQSQKQQKSGQDGCC